MQVIRLTTAPLSRLSIDETVNVRKANRGATPVFTGTIRRSGVLQELIVRENGKGFKIADGGKRYEGLIWLKEHGENAAGIPVADDYMVPIKVVECSDEEAREISLVTNIAREETHPVDRFERFKELIDDGAEPSDIVAAYGLKQRELDQALAIGAMHPKIREAWRVGQIKAEVAQAFTLASDQGVQAKAFDKLGKSNNLHSRYSVRQELKAEDQEIGHLLNFVGRETYEGRGGKITSFDLFEDKHVVSNVELLGELTKEKLQSECALLIAAGWGWAAIDDDMPNGWSYLWQRINPKIELTAQEKKEIERLDAIVNDEDGDYSEQEKAEEQISNIQDAARARAFGTKQMAKSGCVIDVGDDGSLKVKYGIIKPPKAKVENIEQSEAHEQNSKAQAKAEKKKPQSTVLSNALIERLSTAMTVAAAEAVKKHNDRALDITIAAILASSSEYGPGVKISHAGKDSHKAKGSFKSHLEAIGKLTLPKKLDVLANAIGMTFDFECHNPQTFGSLRTDGMFDLFGRDMVEEMRKAFDAEDYFNSVNKGLCLGAITEAVNADEARKIGGKPKSEIAKFAIANVPKSGWLPKELRTAAYDGPGGKTDAKPKKAAAKKRKGA